MKLLLVVFILLFVGSFLCVWRESAGIFCPEEQIPRFLLAWLGALCLSGVVFLTVAGMVAAVMYLFS